MEVKDIDEGNGDGKVIEKVKFTSLFESTKTREVKAVIDTGATMLVYFAQIAKATSYVRKTLSEIWLDGLSLKGWNQ